MAEVKVVLTRSPADKENGVWIDGVKLENVSEVSVFGSASQPPQVVVTFRPKTLILGVSNPDIDKINNEQQ